MEHLSCIDYYEMWEFLTTMSKPESVSMYKNMITVQSETYGTVFWTWIQEVEMFCSKIKETL